MCYHQKEHHRNREKSKIALWNTENNKEDMNSKLTINFRKQQRYQVKNRKQNLKDITEIALEIKRGEKHR